MMTMFELEMIAAQRQRQLAAELDRAYEGGAARGAPVRETMAAALIALAVWLAPSTRAAVAGQAGQASQAVRA